MLRARRPLSPSSRPSLSFSFGRSVSKNERGGRKEGDANAGEVSAAAGGLALPRAGAGGPGVHRE